MFFYSEQEVQQTSPIVTDNLVLHLDAGDTNSYQGTGTTWYDLSGNGNNGSFVNEVSFTSDAGGAIVFDGVDDYVLIGKKSILDIGEDLTVEAWIKQTSTYINNPVVICNGFWSESHPYKFQFEYNNGSSNLGIFRRGGTISRYCRWNFGSQSSYFLNQNVHIIGTVSGSTWKIYYNGIEQAITVSNGSPGSVSVNNTTNTTIAGQLNSAGSTVGDIFPGLVYSARIYDRALTPAEVQQNFNATKDRFAL